MNETHPSPPSLWPREHGAYAQLALPVATALSVAQPRLAALGLVTTAAAAFLAHEPIVVLLGRRGERARRNGAHPARRRLVVLGASGVLGAVAGLWNADATLLGACAMLATVVALSGLLVRAKQEKTVGGEVVIGTTLSLAAMPVALASGVPWLPALNIAAVWAAIFALGTMTVHAVLRRAKSRSVSLSIGVAILGCLFSFGAVGAVALGAWWAGALLPQGILSLAIVALRPSPRHLRRIGWSLLAADLVALAALITGIRIAVG
ncbi:MAG: YwiC-like family protein [Myxococcales bacterium]|nr:YwiC-like family protein [Myxococcales bacterium]